MSTALEIVSLVALILCGCAAEATNQDALSSPAGFSR